MKDVFADVGRPRDTDQQLGQMYELMNSIRNQELEENDPEYKPNTPPSPPTKQE